jgi:cation transport ATPase
MFRRKVPRTPSTVRKQRNNAPVAVTERPAAPNYRTGFLMTPAVGAGLMSASTLIVAINAQLLRFYRKRG